MFNDKPDIVLPWLSYPINSLSCTLIISRLYSVRYIYDIRLWTVNVNRTLWCDSARKQRSSGMDPTRWVNAVDRLPIYIASVQTKPISSPVANAIDSPRESFVYFMSPRQPDVVCGCCCCLCRLAELTNWCGPRVKLNSSACCMMKLGWLSGR